MNGLCSHERLELALAGLLNADEESTLHLHLEDCELCSAEMERLSGGEQASREVASMLMPDELDDALPLREECSTADFVVDHLEPSDDPAVLGRLGGYDVLDIIGRGGMGVVLKGFDRELKRFVAIKALAPHLAHSALARKRFAREAQAAAAVVNLHVIAIHQVQPNGQLPFLVMPLLTGESLAQRLKARGTLELKEILRIGMQAAEGLAAAHGQGLIHRDVKPANILLEKGVERAVLTDFGLARAADDVSMTRWGIIAGTPEYMSPEQARGEALDGRSDLFSLGCVLYEMATGVSPFRADSTMATLRRIVDEQPAAMASLVPELPPWFSHIVERLLSKDPAQRFASASEVSQLLEQCLSHLQQPTSEPLPASLVSHATRRRSIFTVPRIGVIAMLGTIGMTLLGMVLMSASEPPRIADQWVGEDWGVVVLKSNKSSEYEGSFSGTVPDKSGTMQLKWSRSERRFNGTWQEGDHRRGKISLRVVDGEIHGAWTTTRNETPIEKPRRPEIKSEDSESGASGRRARHALFAQPPEIKSEDRESVAPRLGDLLWVRPAKTRGAEHVFGDDVFRSRLRQPGGIPDSEMPRVLLIRTEADVPGGERVAEMIELAGEHHFKFASGSRLKIGNHAVTILFVGANSVIVESDGRWKRWTVGQDFADAVDVGPGLPVTEPTTEKRYWGSGVWLTEPMTEKVDMGSSGTVDIDHLMRVIHDQTAPSKDTPVGATDADALQGDWRATAAIGNGQPVPNEQLPNIRVVFFGEQMTFFPPEGDGKPVLKFTFKVDSSKKPKAITLTRLVDGLAQKSGPGIYALDGDTLKLCLSIRQGKEPPTEFAAPEDSGLIMLTLKRKKIAIARTTIFVLRFAEAKSALAAMKDEAASRKIRGFEATIDPKLNAIAITSDADTLKLLQEILIDGLDSPNANVAIERITVFVLRFTEAKSVFAAMNDEAASRKIHGFKATIDPKPNAIVITSDADTMKLLQEILGRLDSPNER